MVTMRIMKPPPMKMHLAPSRAESSPGALHPKIHSPESKTCTLVLPLTTVSLPHLRALEALYLLSKTADNLCEHWSSTGHSRPALCPTGRRTPKRGSVHWAEDTPRTHHLLTLHPGCSNNDPPLQGLLSETTDRRFLFFLSVSLRKIFISVLTSFFSYFNVIVIRP